MLKFKDSQPRIISKIFQTDICREIHSSTNIVMFSAVPVDSFDIAVESLLCLLSEQYNEDVKKEIADLILEIIDPDTELYFMLGVSDFSEWKGLVMEELKCVQ